MKGQNIILKKGKMKQMKSRERENEIIEDDKWMKRIKHTIRHRRTRHNKGKQLKNGQKKY